MAKHGKHKKSKSEKLLKHKMSKVMEEFKKGTLRTSSGKKVTNIKQAQAIAFSEARRRAKKKGVKVSPKIAALKRR